MKQREPRMHEGSTQALSLHVAPLQGPASRLEGLREHSPVLGNSSLCVGCALLPPLFLAHAQLVGLEPETFHHS
jgi:hypothetical protein